MEEQIKNLQTIMDQFLPGHYEINHVTTDKNEEWFELIEYVDSDRIKYRCPLSTPSWLNFIEDIHAMITDQIKQAIEY